MESPVASDERSYRRGLVLGFTMAEIFILVLFALLLIWMIGVAKQRAVERQARELKDRIAVLEAEGAHILGSKDAANRFDDLFRELQIVRENLAASERKAQALEEAARTLRDLGAEVGAAGGAPTEIARLVRERLDIAQRLITAAAKSGLGSRTDPDSKEAVATTVSALLQIQEALHRAGLSSTDVGKTVKELLAKFRETEGRLGNAERRLQEVSHGTEWPACWADATTGRPEYIFDVALKSASIVVRDNALPHRRERQAMLPIQGMRFETDLTTPEFRMMTAELFKWSERERCRFFVRAFDLTQAHEKAAYKVDLRTVGEHFYYYEELNRAWDAQTALAP